MSRKILRLRSSDKQTDSVSVIKLIPEMMMAMYAEPRIPPHILSPLLIRDTKTPWNEAWSHFLGETFPYNGWRQTGTRQHGKVQILLPQLLAFKSVPKEKEKVAHNSNTLATCPILFSKTLPLLSLLLPLNPHLKKFGKFQPYFWVIIVLIVLCVSRDVTSYIAIKCLFSPPYMPFLCPPQQTGHSLVHLFLSVAKS